MSTSWTIHNVDIAELASSVFHKLVQNNVDSGSSRFDLAEADSGEEALSATRTYFSFCNSNF